MKTKIIITVCLALFGSVSVPLSQPQVPVTTKEFMREKLDRSQKLLAALATEDYFTLEQTSQRLSAMTKEVPWQAFQNPDYTQYSVNFRSHVNALTKAAKDKNIDSATLAYVRMTMSCVDCHKAVRGRLLGAVPPDLERYLARN